MTFKAAKNKLRGYGIKLNSSPCGEEFHLNYYGGTENTSYYTNDLDDAVATGIAMADWRLKYPKSFDGGKLIGQRYEDVYEARTGRVRE